MPAIPSGQELRAIVLKSEDHPSATNVIMVRKLQGLLLFRLLLAFFFLFLTLLVQSRRGTDLLSAHLQPLYLFSCILFLFTIFGGIILKYIKDLKRFAYIQLFFDVEAVTMIIYLSGGVDSLFSFLYMPVIISAAFFLFLPGSLLIASMCSLSFGLLVDLQFFGIISPLQVVGGPTSLGDSGIYLHTLLMSIASFYLVAYLSGYLSQELHKSSQAAEEQKRDFQQLEVLHRNIVQSINSGLITIGSTGHILFFNRAALEILRLFPDHLYGRPFEKIFPGMDPRTWPRDPSPSGHTVLSDLNRMEIAYQCPSGEKLCLGYTVSVLRRDNDGTSGWIFIFQDLTHLKAMEERVRRMERLAFAGQMASGIAHEIKNPLAAISGAIQMIQGVLKQDPVQGKLLGIVEREIDRINDLVTDYLWLAKGARKPERVEEVAVVPAIQEIVTLLRSRQKIGSSHEIRSDFQSSPTVLMDSHHFRQILWNLFTNALESMPGSGELSIVVGRCGNAGGKPEVRIDVSDTGPGIAEEMRDRIFEPFVTTKKSGTGLGLSIVYQLVENAEGRIEVSSKPGVGTTFSLFFPQAPSFPLAK